MVYSNTAVYGVRVRVRVMLGFVVQSRVRLGLALGLGLGLHLTVAFIIGAIVAGANVVRSFFVSNGELLTHGIAQLPTLKNYLHEWI